MAALAASKIFRVRYQRHYGDFITHDALPILTHAVPAIPAEILLSLYGAPINAMVVNIADIS